MPALARTANPKVIPSLPRLSEKPVWLFSGDGSVFDIAAPDQASVCFEEMARKLSRIHRFNGLGIPVAQHLVMGAQAILNEGGSTTIAALYFLHDGHEGTVGDLTRPLEDLLAARGPSLALREMIRGIKDGWDEAIYGASGVIPPSQWTAAQKKFVKSMDLRMQREEIRKAFGEKAASREPVSVKPKTTGEVVCWPVLKAEEAFMAMAKKLLGEDRVFQQCAIAAAARALRASA